jgi:hypothetical protein
MVQFKNFRSPDKHKDIRVTSLSGHVATISAEFSPIPDFLWRDAYASGAISEDMVVNDMDSYIQSKKAEQEAEAAEEFEAIKDALRKIMDQPVGYVNDKGELSHRKAIAAIGKPVKKDVIDKAWKELTDVLED